MPIFIQQVLGRADFSTIASVAKQHFKWEVFNQASSMRFTGLVNLLIEGDIPCIILWNQGGCLLVGFVLNITVWVIWAQRKVFMKIKAPHSSRYY